MYHLITSRQSLIILELLLIFECFDQTNQGLIVIIVLHYMHKDSAPGPYSNRHSDSSNLIIMVQLGGYVRPIARAVMIVERKYIA